MTKNWRTFLVLDRLWPNIEKIPANSLPEIHWTNNFFKPILNYTAELSAG